MAEQEQASTTSFKCALCGDTFETNKQLIKHKTAHTKENRTFTCAKCNKSFTDHCEYLLHEVTHLHHRINHKCAECGALKTKLTFPAHIISHFGERKQACEFCNISLTVEELKRHVKKHSVLNNNCECELCGKILVASKYQIHLAVHCAVKRFHCTHCDKVFKNKAIRDDHVKIHTGEYSEICDVCGQFFRYSKHLHSHKKQHYLESKYICDYCQKEFFTKQTLVCHILRHSRGFLCNYKKCKFAAFTTEEVALHRSAEHYYCKGCERGFPMKQLLDRHLVTRLHKRVVRRNRAVDY